MMVMPATRMMPARRLNGVVWLRTSETNPSRNAMPVTVGELYFNVCQTITPATRRSRKRSTTTESNILAGLQWYAAAVVM